MQFNKLSIEQVCDVYEKYMKVDFPDNERKPLSMILDGLEKDIYECYGLFDKEEILGYAFFIKTGNDYLFDYLAIMKNSRNQGIGTIILNKIEEQFKSANSVIGEVEDPDFATKEEEKILRERRLAFYRRNGYVDTGVRVKLFGVDFIVIALDKGIKHKKEEIVQLYQAHYRGYLPKKIYDAKVIVKPYLE